MQLHLLFVKIICHVHMYCFKLHVLPRWYAGHYVAVASVRLCDHTFF